MKWIFLLFPLLSFSQYFTADVTIGTRHHYRSYMYYNEDQGPRSKILKFQEINPGAIIYWNTPKKRKIGLGLYMNSYRNPSVVLTAGAQKGNFGFDLGFATGYGDTDLNTKILPMVIAHYSLKRLKIGVSPQFILFAINIKKPPK